MSTPMYDIPEHQMMPVDEHGNGPVTDEEAVAYKCWCDLPNCLNVEHVMSQQGTRLCDDMSERDLMTPSDITSKPLPGFCVDCHAYTIGLLRLLAEDES